MLDEYLTYLKELKKTRFTTGIGPIDKTIRGVGGGEVLTIIARAGSFKTAILQNMLLNYAHNSSWAALLCSLEMPIPNITERFLQITNSMTGAEVERVFQDKSDEFHQPMLQQFKTEMGNLYVIPTKASLSDISSYVRLIETEFQIKIGVVGIDYLGLVASVGINEYDIISRIARGAKDLAKFLGIPVAMVSQISRKGGEGDREVTLDMGRGSGAIEEAADFILGLWQEENKDVYSARPYNLICKILKNRKGRKGERFQLELDPQTFYIGANALAYEPPKRVKKDGFG
jgi:replicative DNA helicase